MPAGRLPARCVAGLTLASLAVTWSAGCAGRSTPAGIGVQPSGGPVSPSIVSSKAATSGNPAAAIPRPRRTVVVILENHAYSQVIGSPQAPYLNSLAREGALFTASYAVTHPSEPNYLALLSGSTQGVTGDPCPTTLRAPNLAADLIAAGLGFAGFAEGLPRPASQVCVAGEYARKHVPWTDFTNVPGAVNQPFARFPAGRYTSLPAVSFVIPNLCHDMHDCSVATGDAWIRRHLQGYVRWAMANAGLLIVTWDEDDGGHSNHIATIFVGQQVRPGRYRRPIDHYNVLRTLEQAYGLPFRGQAARHYPITWVWR